VTAVWLHEPYRASPLIVYIAEEHLVDIRVVEVEVCTIIEGRSDGGLAARPVSRLDLRVREAGQLETRSPKPLIISRVSGFGARYD